MKKVLSFILVIILLASLCACIDDGTLNSLPSDSDPLTAGQSGTPTSTSSEPTNVSTNESTSLPIETTSASTEPPHTHSFSAATCTVPKTCACGVTEGNANGHTWKDATCTKPKTCSVCGITDGSASAHIYSDGSCSVCGANDPNYVIPQKTTYVLNVKSKKFHRLTCSKLPTENRQDTTMSRDEIIRAGYDACRLCNP